MVSNEAAVALIELNSCDLSTYIDGASGDLVAMNDGPAGREAAGLRPAGGHFLLHTFGKATGIGTAHILQIQWPIAAADTGHPECVAFRIVIQTRKLTIAKKFLHRWNHIENLHPSGLFIQKVKFCDFRPISQGPWILGEAEVGQLGREIPSPAGEISEQILEIPGEFPRFLKKNIFEEI